MDGTIWYIVLGVVAVAAAFAVRIAAGRAPRSKMAAPTGAAEIAYLNGGAALATLSALAALRADGLVEGPGGRLVQATGEVGITRRPLERAVHAVASGKPVQLSTLAGRRAVAAELELVAQRVAATGLLVEPDPTRATRLAWLAPAAVAALGVAGVVSGFTDDGGTVALVVVLLGAAAAVLALAPRRRARTRAADAVLDRLRREHAHLAPSMNPSWRTYGAAGAAMGVALHGEAALRMAEPEFARAILTGPATARRPRMVARSGRSSATGDSSWGSFAAFDGGSLWSGGGDGGGHGGGGCGGGGCGGGGG